MTTLLLLLVVFEEEEEDDCNAQENFRGRLRLRIEEFVVVVVVK